MSQIQTITRELAISQVDFDMISAALKGTSPEKDGVKLYQRTVLFDNGIEMDIWVISCCSDTSYAQGVLFDGGSEVACTDALENLDGFEVEHGGFTYEVKLKVEGQQPVGEVTHV